MAVKIEFVVSERTRKNLDSLIHRSGSSCLAEMLAKALVALEEELDSVVLTVPTEDVVNQN